MTTDNRKSVALTALSKAIADTQLAATAVNTFVLSEHTDDKWIDINNARLGVLSAIALLEEAHEKISRRKVSRRGVA